jgi:hypothetical protein
MRRRFYQLAVLTAAVVVVGVLARFGWVLATTNVADEVLLRQGRDTLFCLTSGFESDKKPWLEQDDEEQITDLPPVGQARFWVAEVDRILKDQPESPELLMGAALVLDDATRAFHYIGIAGMSPKQVREAKHRRRQPYESISGPKCLEFAQRATELAPDDPLVWRVRAYTLFAFRHDVSEPRQKDWRAVLELCRAHDPSNALYDYLEAEYLLGLGSRRIPFGDANTLQVHDAAALAEATAAMERGAKLPLLVDDRKLHDLSRRIADRAACPEYSREAVAWSSVEIVWTVNELIEYLACLAERRSERNDVDGELKAAKLKIRLVEQVMAARPDLDQYALRRAMAVAQVDLFQRSNVHAAYVGKETLKPIEQNAVDAVLALKLEFASRRNVQPEAVEVDREMLGLRLVVMLLLQPALWLCAAGVIALAASSLLMARLRRISLGPPAAPLGVWRHVVVWLVALTCSFVLFGLGPVGLIPTRIKFGVENLYWTAVLAFCALAVGLLIFWRWMIRAAGQDRQRRRRLLNGGALVMLLLVAMGAVFNVTRDFFIDTALARPQWEFSPPLASHGWFYEPVTADLELPPFDRSALVEWSAYAGVLLAAVAALPLVALWRMRRIARRRRMSILRYWLGRPPNRRRWAAVIRSVANSALAVAALLILTWMALFPSLLGGFEHNEMVRRWNARPQAEIDADYEQERQRILNDPQEMQSLRNQAQADVLAGELTWN